MTDTNVVKERVIISIHAPHAGCDPRDEHEIDIVGG